MFKFKKSVYKAFLLASEKVDVEHFKRHVFSQNIYLYVSNDYNLSTVHEAEEAIYILGYCHDIRDGSLGHEDIAGKLLNINSENFYEELEYINGRYVLIHSKKDKIYIYSDATSMKPVFYNEKYRLVSSHEYLIRYFIREYYNEKLKLTKLYNKGYLDLTNTSEVYKLSPSLELEYTMFNKKRIFPRVDKKKKSVDEVVSEMKPFLEQIVNWLKEQEMNKYLSLTGGVDSRVSLAVSKPIIHQLKFFTYLKPDELLTSNTLKRSYTIDEKIVQQMVENLNLEHEFFYIFPKEENERYYKDMEWTVSSKHSYELSRYLNREKKYEGALHIKSTIQSVGKSSFEAKLYKKNNFKNMMEGVRKWAPAKYRKKSNEDEFQKLLEHYMERAALKINDIGNYHILDLMFLESRLANFQSNITQETDNTLEVFNFFNSRKMIELMLSPDLEARQSQEISQAIITEYWPVLNFFGVNDDENLFEKYSRTIKKDEEIQGGPPLNTWTLNL